MMVKRAKHRSSMAPHVVAVVASPEVIPFDLTIPSEVFGRTCREDGSPAYEVLICSERRTVRSASFDLRTRHGLEVIARAQTVVIAGIEDIEAPVSPAMVRALRSAARRGARVASICTGAFILAAAGLLDGARATTHWLAAPELSKRYSAVTVEAAALYIDNGNIVTSAGAAAGLDMCLHLVRRDFGASVAARTARLAVTPLERDGGQAQYIVHELPTSETTLQPLLRWMEKNPGQEMTIATLAKRSAMSTRTFCRRFQEQVGVSPGQWVRKLRIRHAQYLLERTDISIEEIAGKAGFESASALRERFHQHVLCSPASYRRSFRGS